jgi:uncharacterized protein YjbJ (UPF0337 family)
MHKDELKGKAKVAEGKIQQKFGEMIDDPENQVKGLQKQASGKTQEMRGKVKDTLHKEIG